MTLFHVESAATWCTLTQRGPGTYALLKSEDAILTFVIKLIRYWSSLTEV